MKKTAEKRKRMIICPSPSLGIPNDFGRSFGFHDFLGRSFKDEVDLDVSTCYCEGRDDVLHYESGEGEHQAVAVRGPCLNKKVA